MHTIAKIAVILTAAATAFFFCRAIGSQLSSLAFQVTIAAFIADRWERRINAALPADHAAQVRAMMKLKRGTWPN